MNAPTKMAGPVTFMDATAQKKVTFDELPGEASIDEVVRRLLEPLNLPRLDPQGRPNTYGLRSDREGRLLNGAERLSDTIQPNDTLRLLPTVEAGRS